MNAAEYKTICQQPDVFGRFIIEKTARLMPRGSCLKSQLHAILNQEPIQKPDLYRSEVNNDRFKVSLSVAEAAEIADTLFLLEAEAVSPSGETTSDAAFIAGFVNEWNKYIEFKAD